MPYSLLRGRLTEVRVRRRAKPLLQTTSFALSIGFLALMAVFLWLIHATGWSVARGLWILFASTATLGIAALTISNRVNRRVQRLIDPLFSRSRIDREGISGEHRARHGQRWKHGRALSHHPSQRSRIHRHGSGDVFLIDPERSRYVVVASTLDPLPTAAVSVSEPLATELDRTRRAIHLRGRPDDLEYIPIYVENAAQITACAALCAAPIFCAEELLGFLLCGARAGRSQENQTTASAAGRDLQALFRPIREPGGAVALIRGPKTGPTLVQISGLITTS